jgi:hypothetical protein
MVNVEFDDDSTKDIASGVCFIADEDIFIL